MRRKPSGGRLAVPQILRSVAETLEAVGATDGIYRLSGRVASIQRMRLAFDEGREPVDLTDWRSRRRRSSALAPDVHSLASLLKAYFRELPNPLFTYALCGAFEAVMTEAAPDPAVRIPALQALVHSLPPPHYRFRLPAPFPSLSVKPGHLTRTAAYLMEHLWRVGELGGETGMHHQNLAIVWAPNLFRYVSFIYFK